MTSYAMDFDVIGPLDGADGWHVNTTPQGPAAAPALAGFVIHPVTLSRVWAGDDPAAPTMTVALWFADAATGEAALAPWRTDGEEI